MNKLWSSSRQYAVLMVVLFASTAVSFHAPLAAQVAPPPPPLLEEVAFKDNTTGLWKDPNSWVLGQIPTAAEIVRIPAGSVAQIGTGDHVAGAIKIEGRVEVSQGVTAKLRTDRIDVLPGGTLAIGAPGLGRFTGDFELTLEQDQIGSLGDGVESKQIDVHSGATLDLWGDASKTPWVRMSDLSVFGEFWQGNTPSLSFPDTKTLALDAVAPNWASGDRVAISSTDFDMNQAEDGVLASIVSMWGQQIAVLQDPMAYRHYSQSLVTGKSVAGYGPLTVDMRGSVALLNRNIRIVGDTTAARRWGGHIRIRQDLPAPHHQTTVNISWVELSQMGQYGRLGRYPIHFHHCGDITGRALVEGCSIHHCYHRAVTIHRTNGVEVKNNCAFDIYGHAYFLEDGNEIGNLFEGNLGFLVKFPNIREASWNHNKVLGQKLFWGDANGNSYADTILPPLTPGDPTYKFFRYHDQNPSVFWLSNMANRIVNNVAAGSDAYGFTYDFRALGYDSQGAGSTRTSQNFYKLTLNQAGWLHQELSATPPRVFEFSGNTAHSCGRVGFFSDRDAQGRAQPILVDGNGNHIDHYTPQFVDCTAFKCRKAGVWYRQYGESVWSRLRASDNALGVYFASEGYTEDAPNWIRYDLNGQITGAQIDKQWQGASGIGPRAPTMAHHLLIDSVVVGDSPNTGHDPATIPPSSNPDWEPGVGTSNRSLSFYRRRPNFVNGTYRIFSQSYANEGTPRDAARAMWIKAFDNYDGLNGFANSHVQNFEDQTFGAGNPIDRLSCAFTTEGVGDENWINLKLGTNWDVDPRNYSTGLTFDTVDHRLGVPVPEPPARYNPNPLPNHLGYFYANGMNDVVFHDLDGSMSGAGAPQYVFPSHAALLKVNGQYNAATNPSGYRDIVSMGKTSYTIHYMPVASNPIGSIQIEMPWDWWSGSQISHRTSDFQFLTICPDGQSSLTRDMHDRQTAAPLSAYDDTTHRQQGSNQGQKRVFTANLILGGGNSATEYVLDYGSPPWHTPVPPSGVDFVARLRFGAQGGAAILRFKNTQPPLAVSIAVPPEVNANHNAYFPLYMTQFVPSTTTLRMYQAVSGLGQSSLGNLRSGAVDGWHHDGTDLYLKLILPARSVGPGNNGVFTGAERILLVQY